MKNPRTWVLTVNRPIRRFDATAEHLNSLGIAWERFDGMDNMLCRLGSLDTFDVDRVGQHLSPKHVAACLSHYLLWKTMLYQPDQYFWVLEYDARLMPNWESDYTAAMSVLPQDWDVVFLGSCCTSDKPKRHIGKNLYEVKYPMCGHGLMYHKKALPVLLQEHQKIFAPLDIAMLMTSLPKLNVFTILPAVVGQADTPLPP